ncbi:MAG TPA: hypothetical protein VD866_23600, partial [Urbifossiella sp.]|nr:hypothetical protein [Urbifossiella sp.]
MGAEPERPTEHVTLARVHAVFATLAAAAIVQLAGVNPMTPELTRAIDWFAVAILLNVVCYYLEAAQHAPQTRFWPLWGLLIVTSSFAFFAPLYGMGQVISVSVRWQYSWQANPSLVSAWRFRRCRTVGRIHGRPEV